MYDYWAERYTRLALLERDKICVYCHKKLDEKTVTIDHIIPRSKGGTNDLSNLVACCKGCNGQKQDFLPLNFIMKRIEDEEFARCYNPVLEKNLAVIKAIALLQT